MKKQLLTLALLATVAVGGAFAGNASKKISNVTRYHETGSPAQCTEITCSDIEKPQLCTLSSTLYLNNNAGVCTNPVSDDFIYRAD